MLFNANIGLVRKMFIGGLNWETTDRTYPYTGHTLFNDDDDMPSYLLPVTANSNLTGILIQNLFVTTSRSLVKSRNVR